MAIKIFDPLKGVVILKHDKREREVTFLLNCFDPIAFEYGEEVFYKLVDEFTFLFDTLGPEKLAKVIKEDKVDEELEGYGYEGEEEG